VSAASEIPRLQAVSDVTWQINDFRRCPRPAAPRRIRIFRRKDETFRNFLSGRSAKLSRLEIYSLALTKVSATVSVLPPPRSLFNSARTHACESYTCGHTYDT